MFANHTDYCDTIKENDVLETKDVLITASRWRFSSKLKIFIFIFQKSDKKMWFRCPSYRIVVCVYVFYFCYGQLVAERHVFLVLTTPLKLLPV